MDPLRREGGERGQALLLALGTALALLMAALALVAIAGAITGKGRVHRAADLAAISAARSMRDDLPRLVSRPALNGGLPGRPHLTKAAYLSRARAAAVAAAEANGVSPGRVRIAFPDRTSFAPLRVRVAVLATVDVAGERMRVKASAVAEAAAPRAASGGVTASGGGYGGPLVYRDGEPWGKLFPAFPSGSRTKTGFIFSS